MNLGEMIELGEAFKRLAALPGAAFAETPEVCRVDQLPGLSSHDLSELGRLAVTLARSNYGELEVFGEISGQIDFHQKDNTGLDGEAVSVRATKRVGAGTALFLTLGGFETALENNQFMLSTNQIWVAEAFQSFSTQRCFYSSWGAVPEATAMADAFDSPRRLVRDESQHFTPKDIAPWYLTSGGQDTSRVFGAWKRRALTSLAFALPTEIRQDGETHQVVMKGARSAFAMVDGGEAPLALFEPLNDAIRWVYDQRRDTETKFHLLNNHLALYWVEGTKWPEGLKNVLDSALASAREAFAFHLQEDSKEAIKSLGDLRKALQDDVSRSQVATRDLLSALWRDAAIAGAVFALRTASTNAANVNLIATSAAALLSISLVTTVLSNWRFDALAKKVRGQWRKRLYAFMSNEQWADLVLRPIARARWVYRLSILPVALVYIALISLLLWVSYPTQMEALGAYLIGTAESVGRWVEGIRIQITPAETPAASALPG